METTTTTTETQTQAGKAVFLPLDLDKMKVGHAGLYAADENDVMNDVVDTTPIAADIELGIKGAAKTLIDCEGGIKAFVKELAEDKENGLPNKETGIWIHYLTQGIMNDFHRTWNRTPVSLQGHKSKIEKNREKGKRVLSKKDKNELLAKLTYQYYEDAVNTGEITQAEAFAKMAEAAAKKKELEDAGYFISSKKTQGVSLFDWEGVVLKSHENDKSALKIYSRNQVVLTTPDVITNFFSATSHPKKVIEDMKKAAFYQTLEVAEYIVEGRDKVELDFPSIKNINDIVNYLADKTKGLEAELKDYTIMGVHIAKITKSGEMKPRWVCIDCVSKKDKSQVLFLIGKGGEKLTIRQ